MPRNTGILVALAVLASAGQAQAQEVAVALHGFGSWSYGNTNSNVYLAGRPEGDYRRTDFALNLAAAVGDKLKIHSEVVWREGDDGSAAGLDYAFAEYALSDNVSLRLGQIKQPFGIYTEVFAVGTLRPFIDLPQSLYGPVGFVGQAYKGIGLSGSAGSGSWSLAYDVYGGGQNLAKFFIPEAYYHGDPIVAGVGEIELLSTRNVFGGRLVAHTPVSGLSFGGSAYSGTLDEAAANRRTVVAGQLEYRSNKFTLESEVAYLNQVGDEHSTAYYAQAAYRITPRWQVAGQYDYLKNVFDGIDPSAAPSLQFHKEGAVAINYWFSRSLVLKAEFHRVSGNRFALPDPENLAAEITAGTLSTTTNLVQFGAQFSF